MDEPIIYYLPPWNTHTDEERCYGSNLCIALDNDDKDEFVRLIKDPRFEQKREFYDVHRIFGQDALKCSIAVIEGETKGYIDIRHEVTPLHVAAQHAAPRVIQYLLQRGDDVDVFSHVYNQLSTPIDVAVEASSCHHYRIDEYSLFELLSSIFYTDRARLEIVRLLVQKTQNKERVTQAFIDYLRNGKLAQFATLFLAAPELLVSSSLAPLYYGLKPVEKRTQKEKDMLLLLDVLSMVGNKLVAYVRLAETSKRSLLQLQLDTDFFLREVTLKKLGVTSPDYYFPFHVSPGADPQSSHEDDDDLPSWDDWKFEEDPHTMFVHIPMFVSRKDFDKAYVYSQLPTLNPEDSGRLNRAIEKKLSSMSPLYDSFEAITKISNVEEKNLPSVVPMPCARTIISNKQEKRVPKGSPFLGGRSFDLVRSFHTAAVSAKPSFDFKITPTNSWEGKVMKPTKFQSVFSFVKLSHFPIIAKRLIK